MASLLFANAYSDSSDDEETKQRKSTQQTVYKIDPKEVDNHLNKIVKHTNNVSSRALVSAAPDVVESDNALLKGFADDGTMAANMMVVDPNAESIEFNATYKKLKILEYENLITRFMCLRQSII